ncbi:MAG: SDR family NAD(P)-dependent oxidoreductase [Solirubrobacterales bacterium]
MKEKVVVVTGAMRGLGYAIAERLIANGADVVLSDIDQAGLDKAVADLGPHASGVLTDISDAAQVETLYARTIERHGRLDAVVANAGVGDSAPLGSITEAQFDRIYDINVKGTLFTAQGALPHLGAGGSILIIGSVGSIQGQYGMSMYCGSKAALRGAMRAWIIDIKGSGVRINILSPGAVDTPSLRKAFEDASGPDQVDANIKRMGEQNPLGRLLQPVDVADAAVFLSGDGAAGITGVELFVDGGVAQTG